MSLMCLLLSSLVWHICQAFMVLKKITSAWSSLLIMNGKSRIKSCSDFSWNGVTGLARNYISSKEIVILGFFAAQYPPGARWDICHVAWWNVWRKIPKNCYESDVKNSQDSPGRFSERATALFSSYKSNRMGTYHLELDTLHASHYRSC